MTSPLSSLCVMQPPAHVLLRDTLGACCQLWKHARVIQAAMAWHGVAAVSCPTAAHLGERQVCACAPRPWRRRAWRRPRSTPAAWSTLPSAWRTRARPRS